MLPPADRKVIQKRNLNGPLAGNLRKVMLAVEKTAGIPPPINTDAQEVLQRIEACGGHIAISRRIPLRVKKPGAYNELLLIFSKYPHAVFKILCP